MITGSCTKPVFRLLRGRFWCFRPQGWHVASIGEKFGAEKSTFVPRQISPYRCRGRGVGIQKLNILPNKRPIGAYPLGDFYRNFTVCGQLHGRSCINTWVASLKLFRSYGVLNLGGTLHPRVP